jgi:UDP-N-acetylmuramoyl-tripeptide--D-alanyl-D-alanine ligase
MTSAESLAERERLWLSNAEDFWTLDRVATALELARGGSPRGARSLTGVSTDTRTVRAGELFLALAGENFDAHDLLPAAVAAGAAALVVSQPQAASLSGVPVFVVEDTTRALGMLARYRRRAWGAGKVLIGITGSNGKTSTKELLAAALGSRLEVSATRGNLNNRIGVPLTLLRLSDSAHAAVVEMGSSLPGEIATLSAIAEPEIAIVTSVSEAHLEGLGSLEGVLAEKASIFAAAQVAITPAAQPEIASCARRLTRRVLAAGLKEGDIAADAWGATPDGTGFIEMKGVRINVPLRGVHNLRNAMLALAAALEVGIALEDAASGIATLTAQSMRLEMEPLDDRGTVLINDAYNANPASAIAAIEFLDALTGAGQKVLILGGMLELGAWSDRLHDAVVRRALDSHADIIAGMGDFAAALARAADGDKRVVTAQDVPDLWEAIRHQLQPGAAILLKASRGVRLERIVPLIGTWAAA